ncbi:unnamed protein product, partial [Acanthosepion pharaonis]
IHWSPSIQGIAEENEDPEQQEHIHTNINETISESMESLDESSAAESVDQIVLENDPLLRIEDDELEAWSISVDKKVVKKLSSKEVKRQDNIYELIQTEKNYCRALTIMQKMFYEGLRNEVGVHVDVLNAMFPCLDILLHSHKTFLNNLTILQSQHKDKIIEEIGKALIEQFDGENAMTLKHAYGHFCSHHIEAADIYKEKKGERKFLSFVKRCANNSICQKREIPDFLLLVTQRLTKYPTLIEAIIKNTKDKKERENLNKALELVKDILSSVNNQVEEYEREQRLSDIYNRTDARSSALFRSRKFKKTDLRLNQRKLIHDGVIGWKTARGKVIDVIAVVLTDLIVLMQESNQKYTFIMQDNKSCVIPLCELLVREKGDTKDGKGIYLITKKNTQPEMYEFVCKSTEDMKNWIVLLRSAVEQCPQEVVDNLAFQKLEVKRLLELRAEKMTKLFDSMTHIDTEIVRLCEEKNKKINEYVELYNYSTVDETNTSTNMSAQSTTSTSSGTTTSTTSSSSSSSSTTVTSAVVATGDKCQSKEEGPDAWELLQKAMDENILFFFPSNIDFTDFVFISTFLFLSFFSLLSFSPPFFSFSLLLLFSPPSLFLSSFSFSLLLLFFSPPSLFLSSFSFSLLLLFFSPPSLSLLPLFSPPLFSLLLFLSPSLFPLFPFLFSFFSFPFFSFFFSLPFFFLSSFFSFPFSLFFLFLFSFFSFFFSSFFSLPFSLFLFLSFPFFSLFFFLSSFFSFPFSLFFFSLFSFLFFSLFFLFSLFSFSFSLPFSLFLFSLFLFSLSLFSLSLFLFPFFSFFSFPFSLSLFLFPFFSFPFFLFSFFSFFSLFLFLFFPPLFFFFFFFFPLLSFFFPSSLIFFPPLFFSLLYFLFLSLFILSILFSFSVMPT